MDELRSYRRAARRLALTTAYGCTLLGAFAQVVSAQTAASSPAGTARSQGRPQASTNNLQALLKRGWQANSNAPSSAGTIPVPMSTEPEATSLAELLRQRVRDTSARATMPPNVEFQSTEDTNTISNRIGATGEAVVAAPEFTIEETLQSPDTSELQVRSETEHAPNATVQELVRVNQPASVPSTSMPAPDAVAEQPTEQADVVEESQSEDAATVAIHDSAVSEPIQPTDATLSLPDLIADKASESNQDAIARSAADTQGFGMLALDCLEPPVEQVQTNEVQTRFTATIHETRLRELARESLQTAVHQLSRGATHSAKRSTIEALNHLVAMLDSQDGANHHAKHLAVAQDAIRESREFYGTYGAVEHEALVRMVAVHKTTVLKHQTLQETSALQAVEAYLNAAHENLVAACESAPEASDALVLMGKIEQQMSEKADTHAGAVALTYHRAAVSVDGRNAIAHRELGKTLYGQGLLEQASWSLARSVELQPNRDHYRLLMQIARQMGDAETVRVCETAINDPRLTAPLPIRHLDAAAFAATYKPTAEDATVGNIRNKTVSARTSASDVKATDDGNKSTRSQFKSWLPKFRRE